MAKLTVLSPDHLKSWSRCQKQFGYKYVKRLDWPSQGNFQLGRDVHKLLDYQSRGLDCSLLQAGMIPSVRESWRKLMDHPTPHLPVVANEWAFHVPVGPYWLTGRIDRIARDGENVLIIDWKTGTAVPRLPEADWQTTVYSYAVVEAAKDLGCEGLSPEQVRFVYLEVRPEPERGIREVVVEYNAVKHAAARQKIEATLAAIHQAESYKLPATCPDRYCQYRSACGIDTIAGTQGS